MGAARRAWDASKHPRGPDGRFISAGLPGPARPSLADAVLGTAGAGPKRQRRARDLMAAPKAKAVNPASAPKAAPAESKTVARGRKALAVPPARMKFVVKNPEAPILQQVDEGRLFWKDGTPRGWSAERVAEHGKVLFDYMDESNGVEPWTIRGGTASARVKTMIDDVMAESRIDQDIAVWRGIAEPQHLFGADLDANLAGKTFVDPGYASTTPHRKVAEFYAKGNVLAEIRVPAGTGAIALGGDDAEILLDRDARHVVISDTGPGTSPRIIRTAIEPRSGGRPAKPTRPAPKRPARAAFDAAKVTGALRRATSTSSARTALQGLTLAQLKEVGASAGYKVPARAKKADAVNLLAEIAGRRLDSLALGR